MRALPEDPVFTARHAARCGWTEAQLRHAVRRGRLLRPRRGVYAVPGDAMSVAVRAAALAHPDALVSHRSAALLHGLPVLGRLDVPELTVPPGTNANVPRVKIYRASHRPEDAVVVDGVAVTSVARTLADLGRHRPAAAAVAALDHALHHGLVSVEELTDVLDFCHAWPRVRRAHAAVRLADARAESPLESVSRLTLRWVGLPVPDLQRTIVAPDGRDLGRLDFYWDEFGVAGEADGRAKLRLFEPAGDDPLNREKDRQEAMENLHLTFARWRWEHASWQRQELRRRVLDAFDRGRARDRAGVPRLWRLRPV